MQEMFEKLLEKSHILSAVCIDREWKKTEKRERERQRKIKNKEFFWYEFRKKYFWAQKFEKRVFLAQILC